MTVASPRVPGAGRPGKVSSDTKRSTRPGRSLSHNHLCYSGNGFTEDLYPAWWCVDLMEQSGEMSPDEAIRWKHGIFGQMQLWALEPDDLLTTSDSR